MFASRFVLASVAAAMFGCQAVEPGTTTPIVPPTETPAPAEPVSKHGTEQLLALPPDTWVAAFASDRPGVRLAEYIPPGDANDAWVEKISFESFDTTPLPDPIEMLIGIAREQKETCSGFVDYNTFSGMENGYETSIRLFVCRNNPIMKQGQVTLVKAIRGNEQFYVITRAKRVPPFESEDVMPIAAEDMALWSLYLRAIKLCDPAREAHPCPSPAASE